MKNKLPLHCRIQNFFIRIFFTFIIAPIDFFYEIGQATKNRGHALMWCVMGFFMVIALAYPLSKTLQSKYSLGLDLSAASSNDHVMFVVKKKEMNASEIKVDDYISFSTNKLEPYVPSTAVIIKRVKAVPNDKIIVKNGEVFVNSNKVATLNPITLENLGKKASDFDREVVVPAGSLFVIGSNPRSYDSRYWGFLEIKGKIDRAYPILF